MKSVRILFALTKEIFLMLSMLMIILKYIQSLPKTCKTLQIVTETVIKYRYKLPLSEMREVIKYDNPTEIYLDELFNNWQD